MTPATWLVWQAAGSPDRPDAADEPARCMVCGADADRTVRAKTALGANYDYMSARTRGDRVCVPCTWSLAGKPPATFRLWSGAVTASTPLPPSMPGVPYPSDGRLHLCNRRDQSGLIGVLTGPPDDEWAVWVAQSGQKHLLPYTPTNRGAAAWTVRWEATDVTSTPGEFARLLGAVAALRVAGHHPDTITAGRPSVSGLATPDGMAAWRHHERTITPHGGSPLIALAAHFTTKETIHDLADRYAA